MFTDILGESDTSQRLCKKIDRRNLSSCDHCHVPLNGIFDFTTDLPGCLEAGKHTRRQLQRLLEKRQTPSG